jgi:glycosyltransferase involved in cell wall biosynthesis
MAEKSKSAFRLALLAQRWGRGMPAPVRRLGGKALARLNRHAAPPPGPSEDWSQPLIAGRAGGDLGALQPVSDTLTSPRHVAQTTVKAPVVRALVAIDVLDVGGMDEFAGFLGRRLPEFDVHTVVAYSGTTAAGYRYGGENGRIVKALERDGVSTVQLSADRADAWLAEYRPEVISAHGAPSWLLEAANRLSIPWVETLHGPHIFLHKESWPGEEVRAKGVSALIAVSELIREQYLARITSFPPERIVTIPNGTDERRSQPIDRGRARAALGLEDEFLFLSLARYGLAKNIYGLVAAFADVARANPLAHLLIAGRADDALYYGQVNELARSLPCADRIHLRGHCGNTPALLAAADAFVMDSFFEGWPLASMEALATGLPVVMTDVGGAREQVHGGQRGYLVPNPAGSSELLDWDVISELKFRPQVNRPELVAAMSSLVDERKRWSADRPVLAAQARVAFSASTCLQRHADVLRRVAAGEPLT